MTDFYHSQQWFDVRDSVMERDSFRCVYCQRNAVTADHVTPRSKGGSDTPDNLVAACGYCNKWFGSKYFASIEEKQRTYHETFVKAQDEYERVKRIIKQKYGRYPAPHEVKQIRRKLVRQGFDFKNIVAECQRRDRCDACHSYTKNLVGKVCSDCKTI